MRSQGVGWAGKGRGSTEVRSPTHRGRESILTLALDGLRTDDHLAALCYYGEEGQDQDFIDWVHNEK